MPASLSPTLRSPLLGAILVAAAAILSGCTTTYSISGNSSLPSLDGKMAYLSVPVERDSSPYRYVDSCVVVHGRFSFDGAVDSVVVAQVFIGDERLLPVVIEQGNMVVQIENFSQSVSGGLLNERLYDFLDKRSYLEEQLSFLENRAIKMMRAGYALDEIHETLDDDYYDVCNRMDSLEVSFVQQNYTNELGLLRFRTLCDQYMFPILTPPIVEILQNAPPQFLEHPYVQFYIQATGFR